MGSPLANGACHITCRLLVGSRPSRAGARKGGYASIGTAFVVDSSAAVALPDEPMPLSASTDTV